MAPLMYTTGAHASSEWLCVEVRGCMSLCLCRCGRRRATHCELSAREANENEEGTTEGMGGGRCNGALRDPIRYSED